MEDVPPLVARAHDAARQAGFPLKRDEAGPGRPSARLPGVGRFLAVLAAGCADGRIGELGTGVGVGRRGSPAHAPSCALITAEIDGRFASAACELFAEDPRVQVITGDAFGVLPGHAPFDLLFADSGVRDEAAFATLVSLLRTGGRIPMDDLTPSACHRTHRRRPATSNGGSSVTKHSIDAEGTAASCIYSPPELESGCTWSEATRNFLAALSGGSPTICSVPPGKPIGPSAGVDLVVYLSGGA